MAEPTLNTVEDKSAFDRVSVNPNGIASEVLPDGSVKFSIVFPSLHPDKVFELTYGKQEFEKLKKSRNPAAELQEDLMNALPRPEPRTTLTAVPSRVGMVVPERPATVPSLPKTPVEKLKTLDGMKFKFGEDIEEKLKKGEGYAEVPLVLSVSGKNFGRVSILMSYDYLDSFGFGDENFRPSELVEAISEGIRPSLDRLRDSDASKALRPVLNAGLTTALSRLKRQYDAANEGLEQAIIQVGPEYTEGMRRLKWPGGLDIHRFQYASGSYSFTFSLVWSGNIKSKSNEQIKELFRKEAEKYFKSQGFNPMQSREAANQLIESVPRELFSTVIDDNLRNPKRKTIKMDAATIGGH